MMTRAITGRYQFFICSFLLQIHPHTYEAQVSCEIFILKTNIKEEEFYLRNLVKNNAL